MATKDQRLAHRFHEYSETILETLYGSALTDGQWTPFLKSLIDVTESRSARLLLLNQHANSVQHSVKVNIDDREHQRYVDHYVNTCPWRTELLEKAPGQLYSTYLDFSCRQPQFYRTEFFNDWAKGLDIHHGICGTAYSTEQQKVQLLVQRTDRQGHFTREATNLVNGLLPHVRQALRLSELVAAREERLETALVAAHQHPMPFILLNAKGEVRYLSPSLQQKLPEGLSLGPQGLSLKPHTLDQQFQGALRRITRSAARSQAMEWRFEVPRPSLPPLTGLLTPVHPATQPNLGFWYSDIHVALYIRDPYSESDERRQRLRQRYGLTEAEARLALDIALGHELRAIAQRDNRSIHTLRTRLKAIFAKTHCCRQSQLAALVNELNLTDPL